MPHVDPDARRAYIRAWKKRNVERHRALNKFADAASHANERAAKYGVPGTLRANDIRQCLAVGKCHYCGSTQRLTVDHFRPMDSGGPNTPDNIVAACLPCNISKWRVASPWQWSRRHERCVRCSSTTNHHAAHGLCKPCYGAVRRSRRAVAHA